ncbi:MAG: SEC-C domain-containing protein, partial [Clostridiales bacterium]
MTLYEQWQNAGSGFEHQAEYDNYWKKYFLKEADNYREILAAKQTKLQGKLNELAKHYKMTNMEFVGFLDGINESLTESLDIATLETESDIDIDIDYEKLLFNMHAAKADWLYEMDEWA